MRRPGNLDKQVQTPMPFFCFIAESGEFIGKKMNKL